MRRLWGASSPARRRGGFCFAPMEMEIDSARPTDPQLCAQLAAYRHLARGIAPPPSVWEGAIWGAPTPPSIAEIRSAEELLAAEGEQDTLLLARLKARQAELRDVPTDMPPHMRVAMAVGRQLPSLLVQQRALRAEVLSYADRSRLLDEANATLSLRRARRTRQARELREAERNERKRSAEDELAHRRRRDEFLSSVSAHAEEFRGFHREARRAAQRLGKAVLADFDGKARKDRRDGERERKERLRALRENNMEEYIKLVNDSKNERISQLLQETDKYLLELGAKMSQQKQDVREKESTAGSASMEEDDMAAELEAAVRMKGESNAEKYTERSTYYRLAHTVEARIDEQPKLLKGGQLKEYQMAGLRWLVSLHNNQLNGILADEMGLGKTIQTIALIAYLIESKHLRGPFLVIVPLATLSNWQLEFSRWCPDAVTVVYKGSPDARKDLFEQEMGGKDDKAAEPPFNVVLTTYELIMKDRLRLKKWRWTYIIIDEGHRMKNAASKLASTLLQYEAAHRILLTGTPLQNSLTELWALLNFLLPKIFASADTFEQWFSAPLAAAGGGSDDASMTEEETLLVINRLHQVLRPFLLRRLKTEVLAQLPGKAEYVLKCELSSMQKIMYKQIQGQGLCMVGAGGAVKLAGLNNVEMQLRKVCNHPYLHFGEEQYERARNETPEHIWRSSGKFELLHRVLPKLKALGHRVLIFSQMVKLMDLLQDHLKQYGFKHLRLDGHTKGDDRGALLATFNSDPSYFIFLLSTRAGGQGLNLQAADTVIIFDSDWNPQMDLQAMARAHRIGQKMEVRVLRLITASPIEEKILATANEKLDQEAKIIEAGKFNQTSDASERRETLQRVLAQSADDDVDDAIPTDEEINEMLARPNATLGMTREDEVEFLNQMDAERGETPGLLHLEELPEWLHAAELAYDERAAAADEAQSGIVDGPRERKSTATNPQLSERDFTRFMQSGMELDAWMEYETMRKAKIEEKFGAGGSSGGGGSSAAAPAETKKDEKKAGAGKKAAAPADTSNAKKATDEGGSKPKKAKKE
jgi:ATP-dependent helicase STH1/SNF2